METMCRLVVFSTPGISMSSTPILFLFSSLSSLSRYTSIFSLLFVFIYLFLSHLYQILHKWRNHRCSYLVLFINDACSNKTRTKTRRKWRWRYYPMPGEHCKWLYSAIKLRKAIFSWIGRYIVLADKTPARDWRAIARRKPGAAATCRFHPICIWVLEAIYQQE